MDAIISQKRCYKCKEIKSISEFYGNKGHKDGFDSSCKICRDKYNRQWALDNKAKTKAYIRKWTQAHREDERERLRQYKQEHRELVRKQGREYSRKNSERINAYSRQYYRNHPEKKLEQARRYRAEHPEKDRQYSNNKRARKLNNGGTVSEEEWIEVLEKYGRKCLCCGRDDVKIAMDHVVPLVKDGRHSIENIQPLCKSCNSRKNTKIIDYRPFLGSQK